MLLLAWASSRSGAAAVLVTLQVCFRPHSRSRSASRQALWRPALAGGFALALAGGFAFALALALSLSRSLALSISRSASVSLSQPPHVPCLWDVRGAAREA